MVTTHNRTGSNGDRILVVPDIHAAPLASTINEQVKQWIEAVKPQTISQTKLGKLIVDRLIDGTYCAYVEPSDDAASAALAKELQRNIFVDPSWTQPSDQLPGQNHFFSAAYDDEGLHAAVAQAMSALHGFDQAQIAASGWEATLKTFTE